MTTNDRYKEAKFVTIVGANVNAFLGFIKVIFGLLLHSSSLVADGLHSFSDLLTDITVVFASKFGSQDADIDHPYGHQRIETAATLLLAAFLIVVGIGIGWDALYGLFYKTPIIPNYLALPIALFSVLANELLFYYTKHVGTKIQSPLIIANAWHHRSDAASSLVVCLGILGSLLGFPHLDALAAMVVGLLIIKMGIEYGWNSVKELVDTAVDEKTLAIIQQIILKTPGVIRIHQLRTRFMGTDILIDVHVLVAPTISVSEGHYIAQQVQCNLTKALENINDVVVHIDPEDDEISPPSLHLPNREQLEGDLLLPLKKAHPALEYWVIHYLEGAIHLDLYLSPTTPEDAEALLQSIHKSYKTRLYYTKN